MPPAPGLLSITTFCPYCLDALSARARMTESVEPPAGQGQTRRTGRVGYANWGSAGSAMATDDAAAAWINCRRAIDPVMAALLSRYEPQ
jgi:hypothetical protein